jgi:hypothetical protein
MWLIQLARHARRRKELCAQGQQQAGNKDGEPKIQNVCSATWDLTQTNDDIAFSADEKRILR